MLKDFLTKKCKKIFVIEYRPKNEEYKNKMTAVFLCQEKGKFPKMSKNEKKWKIVSKKWILLLKNNNI